MNSKKEVQHVYLVGAKSLGAYGGYETFVYKLTEYHQNKENIKYHVACKANGDGCMDESKFEGVTKINDHEFEFHNIKVSGEYLVQCLAMLLIVSGGYFYRKSIINVVILIALTVWGIFQNRNILFPLINSIKNKLAQNKEE